MREARDGKGRRKTSTSYLLRIILTNENVICSTASFFLSFYINSRRDRNKKKEAGEERARAHEGKRQRADKIVLLVFTLVCFRRRIKSSCSRIRVLFSSARLPCSLTRNPGRLHREDNRRKRKTGQITTLMRKKEK